jgi:CBS domain-containing protein
MKVAELMTSGAKSCGPQTNLAAITQIMWEDDCGVVPVVGKHGEVVGIITDRDICVALGTRDVPASAVTAQDVMSQSVVGCAPEDDCIDALKTMQKQRVRRLPVQGIGGVLLGVLSLSDIAMRFGRVPAGDPTREAMVDALVGISTHERPARVAVAGR